MNSINPPGVHANFSFKITVGGSTVITRAIPFRPCVEVTRFTKANGPLTKRISQNPDGSFSSDGSNCRMSSGSMVRVRLPNWRDFAKLIEDTPHDTAWALGAMKPELGLPGFDEKLQPALGCPRDANGMLIPQPVKLVPKKDLKAGQFGCGTRTAKAFHYIPDFPAFVLLDHDTKGMPTAVRARLGELHGFAGGLAHVLGDAFRDSGFIRRSSTSSGVHNTATGVQCPSSGEHLFLLIEDGSDARGFLYALHDRCWLAGLGWYLVGAAGQLLERSIIDRSVFGPERLVFEAKPDLDAPLDQAERKAFVHDGSPFGSVTNCPELTRAERAKLEDIKRKAARALDREAAQARANFIRERKAKAVEAGMPPDDAQRMVEQWSRGVLRPSIVLHFDDDEVGQATVAHVLADPERFDGETLLDPLEGIVQGVNCAIVQVRDGVPSIFSFAHGGTSYRLCHDFASIEAAINACNEGDEVKALCRMVPDADLDGTEEETLIKMAASRCKVGIKAAWGDLKAAKAKRKSDTKTDKDARPIIKLDPGQIPRITDELEDALLTADLGLYQRRGNVARICTATIPMPDAPARPTLVIRELNAPELREDCSKAARFVKWDKREGYVETDFPTERIQDLLSRRERMSLPILTAVVSAPIILPTAGRIITAPGYDRETGLYFEPLGAKFSEIPWKPSRADALEALKYIRKFLAEFPFPDRQANGMPGPSETVILSAILSAILRVVLGNVPLYVYNAPVARTGKSLAATLVSVITQGRFPALCTTGRDPYEFEKRFDGMQLWAPPQFVIDNLDYPLESSALCAALTAEEKTIRLFGTLEMKEVSDRPFISLTGNHVVLVGDLTGRSVRATLDARVERPEFRMIKRRTLLLDAKHERGKLCAAALTMFQAFRHDNPHELVAPLGNFEKWSRNARESFLWLGCGDVCETMESIRKENPKQNDLLCITSNWFDVIGMDNPCTAREAIAKATERETVRNRFGDECPGHLRYPDFHDALMSVAASRGEINAKRLGNWIRDNSKNPIAGKYFDAAGTDRHDVMRWVLLTAGNPTASHTSSSHAASKTTSQPEVVKTKQLMPALPVYPALSYPQGGKDDEIPSVAVTKSSQSQGVGVGTKPDKPAKPAPETEQSRRCVQCKGEPDGKEELTVCNHGKVWLHPECRRFYFRAQNEGREK